MIDPLATYLKKYHFELVDSKVSPAQMLRLVRERRRLTQEQLAIELNIYQSNISAMESGKRPIGKAMRKRLGKALGVSSKIFA